MGLNSSFSIQISTDFTGIGAGTPGRCNPKQEGSVYTETVFSEIWKYCQSYSNTDLSQSLWSFYTSKLTE